MKPPGTHTGHHPLLWFCSQKGRSLWGQVCVSDHKAVFFKALLLLQYLLPNPPVSSVQTLLTASTKLSPLHLVISKNRNMCRCDSLNTFNNTCEVVLDSIAATKIWKVKPTRHNSQTSWKGKRPFLPFFTNWTHLIPAKLKAVLEPFMHDFSLFWKVTLNFYPHQNYCKGFFYIHI